MRTAPDAPSAWASDERVARGGDVVHPEEPGTALVRQRAGRRRAGRARSTGPPVSEAEEPLARRADQDRPAERLKGRELVEQEQILLGGLGEAEARVDHDRIRPRIPAHSRPSIERLAARRARLRRRPHRNRRAAYDASSRMGPRECIRMTPARAPATVAAISGSSRNAETSFTSGGPRVQRRARHLGLHGVDGDDQVGKPSRERLDHRQDPPQLLRRPAPRRCGRAGWTRHRHRGCWRRRRADASACARAASTAAKRPPSLKLSGVTLRMPTRTGRSRSTRAAGGLPVLGGCRRPARGRRAWLLRQRLRDGPGRANALSRERLPARSAQSSPVTTSSPRRTCERDQGLEATWSSPVR